MDSVPPIKRLRLTDWICKQDSAFYCIQETHLSGKDRHCLRVKCWKKAFQASDPKKQAGVAILIPNKLDFQPKLSNKMGKGTSYSSKENSTKRKSQS
jgi:exonuclease III